jgi:hypothetical protein
MLNARLLVRVQLGELNRSFLIIFPSFFAPVPLLGRVLEGLGAGVGFKPTNTVTLCLGISHAPYTAERISQIVFWLPTILTDQLW